MTVIDYFNNLMEILEKKLIMNVGVEDVENFDMYKWIWDADKIPEDDAPEMIEKLRPD